jgi:acyl carrier protein phosphodiesterase
MDHLSNILFSPPKVQDVFCFTVLKIYAGHQVRFEDSRYEQYLKTYKQQMEEFFEHPSVIASGNRIRNSRFARLFLPIVYDHFMYKYWDKLSVMNREEAIESTHQILLNNLDRAPKRSASTILTMVKKNIFHKYGNLDGLPFINASIHKLNPIYFQNAMNDFISQYDQFQKDFENYMPVLIQQIKHAQSSQLVA